MTSLVGRAGTASTAHGLFREPRVWRPPVRSSRSAFPHMVPGERLEPHGVTVSLCFTEGRGMARGRKTALTIMLTPAERRTLLAWQRATTISAGRARRGRIIVLVADGVPIATIAATIGISRRFVYTWAQRFLTQGVEGLADKPGRGSWRVLRQSTPAGAARQGAARG
jgi:hypothetical protein